jgi:hypothetical protein
MRKAVTWRTSGCALFFRNDDLKWSSGFCERLAIDSVGEDDRPVDKARIELGKCKDNFVSVGGFDEETWSIVELLTGKT